MARLGAWSREAATRFEQDAGRWGISPGLAAAFAALPLVAVAGMVATIPVVSVFRWMIEEDSPVEWAQFIFLFAAGLIFGLTGAQFIRMARRGIGLLYLLAALAVLFVAGEEISWGQRLLGWDTPESLQAINAQQETSVHNIYSFHELFIYAVMLTGLYGTLAPLSRLGSWITRYSSPLTDLLIPPLCLVPSFFMPFGYRLCRLLFSPELHYPHLTYPIIKFSEVAELCLYFGVLTLAWLNLRRHRPRVGTPSRRPRLSGPSIGREATR